MKIDYIEHSSFLVSIGNIRILFDYVNGSLPEFSSNDQIYVFVSHSHYDHYNKEIFNIFAPSQTKFILADDINIKEKDNILKVRGNEKYELDDLEIETLTSTDSGVAYIITIDNFTIYHAGDLNNWSWEEADKVYNQEMKTIYEREISKIKDRNFDVAFIVVDPRQGNLFYEGIDYFMRNTRTKMVYPMHYWGKKEIIDKLKNLEITKNYREKIK